MSRVFELRGRKLTKFILYLIIYVGTRDKKELKHFCRDIRKIYSCPKSVPEAVASMLLYFQTFKLHRKQKRIADTDSPLRIYIYIYIVCSFMGARVGPLAKRRHSVPPRRGLFPPVVVSTAHKCRIRQSVQTENMCLGRFPRGRDHRVETRHVRPLPQRRS